MNPSEASQPDSFSWSAFEHLEDLANFDANLDDLSIPDATYRQLKELNQALIEKARQLTRLEAELERERGEFELVRQSFEAFRIQSTRESTESRLDRIIRHDRKPADGQKADSAEDCFDVIRSTAAGSFDSADHEFADSQSLNGPGFPIADLADLENIEFVEEIDASSAAGEPGKPLPSSEELDRFRNSVRELREKSEVISAVFIELDQMVRDLNRQQELLDQLNLNPGDTSTEELSTVNHQLKRRFRRLSRQIKIH